MKQQTGKEITVTGTALHAKAGAVVETYNGVYYIRDKHDWGNLYGKTVTVTGTLETVEYRKEDLVDENGAWSQGFAGPVNYIANAKVTETK